MRKLKILIADDEEPNRFALKIFLVGAGHEVIQASNGVEVMELLEKQRDACSPVDLVLLDLQMPDCSGLDVIKQLRGFSPYPEILIMTGDIRDFERIDNDKKGYSGVLRKPFNKDELLAEMNKVVAESDGGLKKQQWDNNESWQQR
jgi:DNA-binding response OmpR family regulator